MCEQRRVHRLGSRDRAQRRGLVQGHGQREVPGLHAVLAVRPREAPRPVRGAAGHHAARAARLRRRRPARPPPEVLDPRRLLDADVHRGAPRRPAGLRGRRRGRLHARHQGAADLRRDHLRGARGAALDRVLRARVLRQVHALPRGHLLARADPQAHGEGRGHRGRPRQAARPVRQHRGQGLLRPRRRRRRADHSPRSSTSGTSTWSTSQRGGCPFDPSLSTAWADGPLSFARTSA